MWTQFWDMHSGGGTKQPPYERIYIEAPEGEAKTVFYNRFGHNPSRVSCTCCGDDYAINEYETLEQATAYHRGCDYAYVNEKTGKELPRSEAFIPGKGVRHGYKGQWMERPNAEYNFNPYRTLEEYLKLPDVLMIPAVHIKPDERRGDVPEQGYVWRD